MGTPNSYNITYHSMSIIYILCVRSKATKRNFGQCLKTFAKVRHQG